MTNNSNINENRINSKINVINQENNQLKVEPDISLPKITKRNPLILITPVEE